MGECTQMVAYLYSPINHKIKEVVNLTPMEVRVMFRF